MRNVQFVRGWRKDERSQEKYKEDAFQNIVNQQSIIQPVSQIVEKENVNIEVSWMRKLGFTSNLQLNNGYLNIYLE